MIYEKYKNFNYVGNAALGVPPLATNANLNSRNAGGGVPYDTIIPVRQKIELNTNKKR